MITKIETFTDDNGVVFSVPVTYPTLYNVYVLFSGVEAVYVGYSKDIATRIYHHKNDGKKFDSYKIIMQTQHKKVAVEFERVCIIFLKNINSNCLNNTRAIFIKADLIYV